MNSSHKSHFRKACFILTAMLIAQPIRPAPGSPARYSGAQRGSDRKALLVGINIYEHGYATTLNFCVADARGIRDTMLLEDPAGRWSSGNITLLTDARATKARIRNALNTLASETSAGDLVLYYHSGHGGQTDPATDPKKAFLFAYDMHYKDSELAADLAEFNPQVNIIVIIDACHSAGMFKRGDQPREWPFAERVMTEYRAIQRSRFLSRGMAVPKSLGDNIAFMTACDYDEWSWEMNPHGIFTGYLLAGCRTPSVDTNQDGEYQFMELFVYAAAKAAAATAHLNPQQHAQSLNDGLLGSIAARALSTPIPFAGLNNDYNGDGVSDIAMYHEETGLWFILSLRKGVIAWGVQWGGPGFKPVSGDYNGDGIADLAVYHEATGEWFVRSLTKGLIAWGTTWGMPGLTPVAGDYSGNGVTDLAVYEKSSGYWYVVTLSGRPIMVGTSMVGGGFRAVPGDYSGNGRADCAMYHRAMGYWYIASTSGSTILSAKGWGSAWHDPVPGDYDGNGVCDLAVYCRHTGRWYIWSHSTNTALLWDFQWGGEGYTPVQGDFNGDGKWDLAVYHENTGGWFIKSADGKRTLVYGLEFGGPGFIPVLSSW